MLFNDPDFGLNKFRYSKDGGEITSSHVPIEKNYSDANSTTDARRNCELELDIDIKRKYTALGYNSWDIKGKETITYSLNPNGKLVGVKYKTNVQAKGNTGVLMKNDERTIRPFLNRIEVPVEFPELGASDWIPMNAQPQGLVQQQDDGKFKQETHISTSSSQAEQKQAFEKAKRFADMGDANAVLTLVHYHWEGIGTPKNQMYACKLLDHLKSKNLPTTGYRKAFLGWVKA